MLVCILSIDVYHNTHFLYHVFNKMIAPNFDLIGSLQFKTLLKQKPHAAPIQLPNAMFVAGKNSKRKQAAIGQIVDYHWPHDANCTLY